MADQHATPRAYSAAFSAARRVRLEANIYRRRDGALELGYRDSDGKQRWRALGHVGIKHARAERDTILGARGKGERVVPSPKLRFGEAAERWLAGPVAELRPSTRSAYRNALRHALRRWQRRRLDAIGPDQCVELVRELRAEGLADSYAAASWAAATRCSGTPAGTWLGRTRPWRTAEVRAAAEPARTSGVSTRATSWRRRSPPPRSPGRPCSGWPPSSARASRSCWASGGRTWAWTTSTRRRSPSPTRWTAPASACHSRPRSEGHPAAAARRRR